MAFVDIDAGRVARRWCRRCAQAACREPWYRSADVTDARDLQRAIRDAAAALGDFHVLVNNVASDDRHAITDVTPEYYDERIAVNQRPAFFAIQAVVPGMKKMGGGSIINFGSTRTGANKTGGYPVYTTAKSSVIGPHARAGPRTRRTPHPHQRDHAGLGHDRAPDARKWADARHGGS